MKYLSNPIVYFIFAGIMIIVASQIAWQTRYRAHPDEISHGNSFCYFETHAWIPDLNSDDVFYDPYGWNRVYDAELVYIAYGRIVGMIRPATEPILRNIKPQKFRSPGCEPVIEFYRGLNLGLYVVTLLAIYLAARKTPWLISIATILLSIPQVIYIYSYANDDAWGVSFSILLFLYAVRVAARARVSYHEMIYLGILTGLVLVSKKQFWISIPFAYLNFLPWAKTWTIKNYSIRALLAHLVMLGATIFIIAAPLRIYYPLTQGNFDVRKEQTLEQRAREDLKPSSFTGPGYRLASRGVSFQNILTSHEWTSLSLKSFYGLFGYFSVILPSEWYRFAAGLMLLLCVLTGISTVRNWTHFSPSLQWLFAMAPIFLALNILASMYNSWMYDYQPQGRYLFSSLVPCAIILSGTIDFERGPLNWLRVSLWLILYAFGVFVLWTMVAQNPIL